MQVPGRGLPRKERWGVVVIVIEGDYQPIAEQNYHLPNKKW